MDQHRTVTFMIVTAGLLASGCAGRSSEVKRLESQIGMIDERLSQLERGSAAGSSMDSSGEAAPVDLPTVTGPSTTTAEAALEDRLWTKPTPYDVQQALKNAGFYHGTVDGKPGAMTKNAIREFQRVQGLKVDGVVGKRTWEKLSPHLEGGSATVAAAPVK